MSLSDLIGAGAGVLLVIAPLRDQYARAQVRRAARRAAGPARPLHALLATAWERHRNDYSALDAWTQLAGAAGLTAAFGLKLLGA